MTRLPTSGEVREFVGAPTRASMRGSTLPVGRVVRRQGWDPSTFSRVFKRAYGVSPRTFCQRVRVHDAMMMLLRGASIANVALDAGFGDVIHFYRQFQRITGNAPGRYRTAGRRRP